MLFLAFVTMLRERLLTAFERENRELVAFAISPDEVGRLKGWPIEARTAFTLYVRDPDGRRIGLSAYPDPLPT